MGGLIYFVLIIPAFFFFSSCALRRRDRAQRLQDPDRDHADSRPSLLLNCLRSLLIGPTISNNFEADRAI